MNKIRLWCCFGFSFLFIITIVHSQQKNVSPLHDSLMLYKNQKDYLKYFKLLNKEEIFIYNDTSSAVTIKDYNVYYNDYLETELLNNIQDIRYYIIYHAFYTKKTTGFREAIPFYLLAHKSITSVDSLDKYAWYVENELGNYYARLGDYNQSLYYYGLVENFYKSKPNIKVNKVYLARLATNQGICYRSQDRYEKAIKKFKTAYSTSKQQHLSAAEMSNARELASTYAIIKQIDSANHYYNIAYISLKRQPNIKTYYNYLSNIYGTKADILASENQYSLALFYLRKSEEALFTHSNNRNGRTFAKLYFQYAQVYLQKQKLDKSIQYLHKGLKAIIPSFTKEQILPTQNQIHSENTFFEILELYAMIYKEKYNIEHKSSYLDSALYCIDLAYIANDKLREKYTHNEASLMSIEINKKLFNLSIETTYQLYTFSHEEKYIKKALSLSDRSKSMLLKGKLREGEAYNKLSIVDKEKLATMEQTLIELYQKQGQSIVAKDSLHIKIQNLKNKVDKLLVNPKLHEKKHIYKKYIEYIVTGKEVYSLDNFEDKTRFKRLGLKDELFTMLNQINKQLIEKESTKNIANKLYQYLFPPDIILPNNITVIPDDRLAAFPFEILIHNEKLLLENHQISYAYHKNQLSTSSLNQEYKDNKIVCILPKYDTAPTIDFAATRNELYQLDYAAKEVEQIAKMYGKGTQLISDISKSSLPKFIKNISILHFAGHAKAVESKAFLAFNSSKEDDSRWYDYEISESRNNMELVVLSACETGIGKYNSGEGIQSLGRSFQAAGTKACLMSLWSVNDKATSEIITSFFKYLKAGMNKAKALQKAKIDYIEHADPAMSTPYYWSGFVLVGDTKAIFPENNWTQGSLLLILLALILIISIYLVKRKKTII